MTDLMAKALTTQRVQVALLTAMAALALLLSALGIFALVANTVGQRTREIGIRLALGSTVREAMIQASRSGVGASALGLVLGLILGAGALRALRSALYGVEVYDTPTIAAVIVMLAAVTLVAAIVPTLRVARIDPARTLREQ
jgi:ABC-type antimicrobial peptide transport system permease subunit